MKRHFLTVAYDGVLFHGSQIQGDLQTVQLLLNNSLSTILRMPIETYGASRTDEGVHAVANVYHFDAEVVDTEKLRYQLNALLPQGIAITSIRSPRSGVAANCRFDAISRLYRYDIHFRKNPFLHQRSYLLPLMMDTDLLHATAEILYDYQDFTTFSKRNTQSFTNNCTIITSQWDIREDGMSYTVRANRFLRGMVRALVGTQLHVARGRYGVDEFKRRIDAGDCSLADFSVPGYGLYLIEVAYPNEYFL